MNARVSPLRRFATHASHYSLGSLLTTLAGFVSFPLLTRVFSVADYGVMSVVGVSVTIAVAVGKLGVNQSVLRYHSEISAGKRPFTLGQLSSTTLLGMLGTGVLGAALVFAGSWVASARTIGDPRVRQLLAIMCVAIVAQTTGSALVNFTRAEMRTKLFMAYQVGKRYVGLALILAAVFLVARSLVAFYVATALGETIAVLALGLVLLRRGGIPRPTPGQFSLPLYKEMLRYGIPMLVGNELAGIVLAVGDRYVIRGLIGDEPLGLYSAAYNLCEYVQLVLLSSVGQAIMPLYLETWDQRGREATVALIDDSLRSYVLLGAPVIAGVAAVGPDLLPALASSKYASAASVLPWVIAGMVVAETNTFVGAGLFIQRRTRRVMAIILSCAALNIALNFVLIPRVGIVGSAVATLVAYAATSVLFAWASRSLLPVTWPWRTVARAGAVSLAMWAAVSGLWPGHHLLTVGVRAVAGVAIYAALMWAIDPDARMLLDRVLRRAGGARAQSAV